MNAAVVEFTGLYGQKVTLRAKSILRIIAYRVWTEILMVGGTTVKVLEDGDEVKARMQAALQPERTETEGEKTAETPETDGAGTAENADTTGTEDTDCTGKDACDIPGTEEAEA